MHRIPTLDRRLRTRIAAAAVAPLLAVGLVACGEETADSDDGAVAVDPAVTTSVADQSTQQQDDTTTDQTDTSATETPATGGGAAGGALAAAATTATGEVQGKVFSVDRQDTGDWEVSVVADDGTENDVTVSADGTTVVRGPVEDQDDDTRDRAERQRLLGVQLDHLAAVEAATGSATGELTGVSLDEEAGAAVWEVQYGEDTPDEVTVHVDAESGEVVHTENGD